jgi:hypothetical protein
MTLFDLPPFTLQIATFQELGVPYAFTEYCNLPHHLALG